MGFRVPRTVSINKLPSLPPQVEQLYKNAVDKDHNGTIDLYFEYLPFERENKFQIDPGMMGPLRNAFFGTSLEGGYLYSARIGDDDDPTSYLHFSFPDRFERQLITLLGDETYSSETRSIDQELEGHFLEMITHLRALVERNTYSYNPDGAIDNGTNAPEQGVNNTAAYIKKTFLDPLGFEVQTLEPTQHPVNAYCGRDGKINPIEERIGNHLLARRKGRPGAVPIALVGHLDTVYEFIPVRKGGWIRMEPAVDNLSVQRYTGPGIADMKGGLIIMLFTLFSMARLGLLDEFDITLLLNSDEEIGSPDSKKHLEEIAKNQSACFVFERSAGDHMTLSREGIGHARVLVQGIGTASTNLDRGVNARLEAASQDLDLWKLYQTKLKGQSIKLNVGPGGGGTLRNIVPACSWDDIEFRYPDETDEAKIREDISKILSKPRFKSDDGETAETKWTLTFHRPPKKETPETRRLFELYVTQARRFDPTFQEGKEPGNADGSLLQRGGCPTLDSVGAKGGEVHTPDKRLEYIETASLLRQAEVLAGTLRELRKRETTPK